MKVVINKCFGGFGLSTKAHEWLIKNRGWKVTKYNEKGNMEDESAQLVLTDKPELYAKYWDHFSGENRTHKDIIDVVEKLKDKASDTYSKLEIVEIPDSVEWEIDEYDGNESIEEKHRSWG